MRAKGRPVFRIPLIATMARQAYSVRRRMPSQVKIRFT